MAEYEAQSYNKEDQVEQKALYIKMFESVKSYNVDQLRTWLDVEAFKHKNGKHTRVYNFYKMLIDL